MPRRDVAGELRRVRKRRSPRRRNRVAHSANAPQYPDGHCLRNAEPLLSNHDPLRWARDLGEKKPISVERKGRQGVVAYRASKHESPQARPLSTKPDRSSPIKTHFVGLLIGMRKEPLALLALVLKPAEPEGTTAYFVTPSVEATGNKKDERSRHPPFFCHFERSEESCRKPRHPSSLRIPNRCCKIPRFTRNDNNLDCHSVAQSTFLSF